MKVKMDKTRVKKLLSENIVVIVLILLCIGFGIASDTFFSVRNVSNILSQMCTNALLASGLTYVIILGGIDISVGSVVAVAGIIASYAGLQFPNMGIPFAMVLLIVCGITVGLVCGFINGVLIAYFDVIPMICTLSTMTALRGVAYVITGGQPVYGLPTSFAFLGASRIIPTAGMPNGAVPVVVIFTIIVVAIMHILLSQTVFGRHVFAVGSNKNVAHLSGINVRKITFLCHVLSSVMAGLCGVVIASKLQNGQPGSGEGYEMFAIASTVLGGTSLAGGSGSVARAMFGCAVIAVIKTGMDLLQIYSYWQNVVIGCIIILAVVLDMAQKRGRN
ncbi:MAG: ABC transporter permease [Lachnospiraceae bacterium]|jgi:ribose transport system permease protein|nr:ABC transporter permease [Lachnospiraceae bacterium]